MSELVVSLNAFDEGTLSPLAITQSAQLQCVGKEELAEKLGQFHGPDQPYWVCQIKIDLSQGANFENATLFAEKVTDPDPLDLGRPKPPFEDPSLNNCNMIRIGRDEWLLFTAGRVTQGKPERLVINMLTPVVGAANEYRVANSQAVTLN